MQKTVLLIAFAVAGLPLMAQNMPRRATFQGGAGPGSGKCTVEVVVDGAAEVDIRGDNGNLRNLNGQQPQWRRFECTGPLPPNPGDFRFAGVDGRGRQTLIQDPRGNGGTAVIRIEDPENGSDAYGFEIMWGNGGGNQTSRNNFPPPERRQNPDDRDGRFNQAPNGRDREDWHRDRDAFIGRDDWKMRLFDRVKDDVEHVRATTFYSGPDQYRLGRASQELNELQAKLSRGFFDRREVGDVILILRGTLQDRRLERQDYEILNEDVGRLQDFQQRHEEYGAH